MRSRGRSQSPDPELVDRRDPAQFARIGRRAHDGRAPRRRHARRLKEDHMLSRSMIIVAALTVSVGPVSADVLTDWNEKTVALVTPRMAPAAGGRVVAMVHVAMFDAINSIERRYRPYLVQLPAAAD